jgi:hypothetical protein
VVHTDLGAVVSCRLALEALEAAMNPPAALSLTQRQALMDDAEALHSSYYQDRLQLDQAASTRKQVYAPCKFGR